MCRAPRTSTAPSRSPELAQTKTFVSTPNQIHHNMIQTILATRADVRPVPTRAHPQLGIPSTEERIEMILKSGKEPGMTARDYLAFVSEQRKAMGVSDESGLRVRSRRRSGRSRARAASP